MPGEKSCGALTRSPSRQRLEVSFLRSESICRRFSVKPSPGLYGHHAGQETGGGAHRAAAGAGDGGQEQPHRAPVLGLLRAST